MWFTSRNTTRISTWHSPAGSIFACLGSHRWQLPSIPQCTSPHPQCPTCDWVCPIPAQHWLVSHLQQQLLNSQLDQVLQRKRHGVCKEESDIVCSNTTKDTYMLPMNWLYIHIPKVCFPNANMPACKSSKPVVSKTTWEEYKESAVLLVSSRVSPRSMISSACITTSKGAPIVVSFSTWLLSCLMSSEVKLMVLSRKNADGQQLSTSHYCHCSIHLHG